MLHFVPSMLSVFLEEPGAGECRTLRAWYAAARRSRRAGPALRRPPRPTPLHNLYGPTETAIDVTSWVCGHG